MSAWEPVTFRGVRRAHERVVTGCAKHVEDDDPYELVGVRFPVAEGEDSDRELARIFVEEYALMGWSPTRIRELFDSRFFAGTNDLVHRRGHGIVDEAITTVFGSARATGER